MLVPLPARVLGLIAALAVSLLPNRSEATCFCMMRRRPPPSVSQQVGLTADPSYNPASAVFLAREGTRTVMTIEAVYDGPAEEISIVIPIPQSIDRSQVRTVSGTAFRNLDRRTAPSVKHVWPACRRRRARPRRSGRATAASADGLGGGGGFTVEEAEEAFSIDIEDQWEVQEYDITMLSAEQSNGLLRYLATQNLQLPPSAEPVLMSYIQTGHRFIVAKANPARANRLGDKMMLSPIQLEYDSEQLRVPVRLGTLNSPGEQELLLYVLSKDGRYEMANRPNVNAPTDLRLREDAAGSAAELYASLMNETFRRSPGAAVTEFSRTLGSRVWRNHVQSFGLIPSVAESRRGPRETWTLTRIRHRYGKDLSDDLTLRRASAPLRMTRRWRQPELSSWAPRGESGFHVRFVVEHRGASCPSRERQQQLAQSWATAETLWSSEGDLWPGRVLLDAVPELGITPGSAPPPNWNATPTALSPDIKPEPAPPVEPPKPPESRQTITGMSPVVPSPPATPTTTATDDDGFCSASGRTPLAAFWLVVAAMLWNRRRFREVNR